MVPLINVSQPGKRHLDRFSRLCTVHPCDQHTHRHTDHVTCAVCNERPHLLCTACRRCGL